MSNPVNTGSPAGTPARSINAGAFVGLGLVVVGFLVALVPLAGVVGWPLMLAGLILGIIGAAKKWNPKWVNITNIVLGFAGPGLALMLVLGGLAAAGGAAEGTAKPTSAPSSEASGEKPAATEQQSDPAAPAFADGVLTTADAKIEITKHAVIPVGAAGNEYGTKPVIAFWYRITNVSGSSLDPTTGFMTEITASQGDGVKLQVGPLPDPAFLNTQLDRIAKGASAENAIAYTLADDATPVDLVAADGIGGAEIGRTQYTIK